VRFSGRDWARSFERRFGCRVRRHEPLSRHTTFGVGGEAELLAWLEDEGALFEARRYLDAAAVPLRILGTGSNVLVADGGVAGAILKLSGRLASLRLLEEDRHTLWVEAGGGAGLQRLLTWSLGHGAGGLEGLWGIPGTVGGAVKMNAGTRWGTVGDRLVEVRLLSGGTTRWVPASSLNLGYRRSGIGPRRVVVAARFRLPRKDPKESRKRIRQVQRARLGAQPSRVRSAGSFFRNPPEGPAGRWIEQAGCKGARVGKAFVSERHANFIVHRGGASAEDILRLSRQVARRVHRMFGIRLRREVELWGRFGSGSRRER
jgi:UDP-N-acetylenolpyruvoylglucosamine reductase